MKRKRQRARVLRSRRVFGGRVFEVYRETVSEPPLRGRARPRPALREIVRHGGSVVVLPVFPDGRVLLVRQYRHAAGDFLWELVAGHIERGERPGSAARRELQEETGYRARRWQRLAEFFPTPGFLTEKMVLYRASGLRAGRARPEGDEQIEARAFPRAELARLVRRKQLRDGKTLIGVLLELARGGA
jgi:ADP-ribose pyrophosphatase